MIRLDRPYVLPRLAREAPTAVTRGDPAELYDEVASILERHDPMGVVLEALDPDLEQLDEYDPEATAIVARLGGATSADDVEQIVRDVFREWFGEEPAGLDFVASEIWALMRGS